MRRKLFCFVSTILLILYCLLYLTYVIYWFNDVMISLVFLCITLVVGILYCYKFFPLFLPYQFVLSVILLGLALFISFYSRFFWIRYIFSLHFISIIEIILLAGIGIIRLFNSSNKANIIYILIMFIGIITISISSRFYGDEVKYSVLKYQYENVNEINMDYIDNYYDEIKNYKDIDKYNEEYQNFKTLLNEFYHDNYTLDDLFNLGNNVYNVYNEKHEVVKVEVKDLFILKDYANQILTMNENECKYIRLDSIISKIDLAIFLVGENWVKGNTTIKWKKYEVFWNYDIKMFFQTDWINNGKSYSKEIYYRTSDRILNIDSNNRYRIADVTNEHLILKSDDKEIIMDRVLEVLE